MTHHSSKPLPAELYSRMVLPGEIDQDPRPVPAHVRSVIETFDGALRAGNEQLAEALLLAMVSGDVMADVLNCVARDVGIEDWDARS